MEKMNSRQKEKEINTGVTKERKKMLNFAFFSIRSYNELNRKTERNEMTSTM